MKGIDICAQNFLETLDVNLLRFLKRANLLRRFVREILISESIKHINISHEIEQKLISNFYKDKRIENINQRKKFLSYHGLNESDLHYQILVSLKIKKVCLEKFKDDVDSHFLKRKEELDQFVYSIIRVDNADLAHEIYLRIEAKEEEFSSLANKYSKEKNVYKNGLMGPSSIVRCHPLLKESITSSIPGDLIKPFKLENSWIILRVEEKKPAKLDLKMEEKMMFELFEIYIQKMINKILRNLIK